jgi:stage II sporulation protein D
MSFRKILGTVLAFLLLIPFSNTVQAAYNKKSYPNRVSVQLADTTNATIKLNGVYELYNKSSNQKTLLVPGVNLSVTGSGSSVTVKAGTVTYQSSSGFEINETQNLGKIARFTSDTNIHSGALSSYPIKKTVSKVEVVEYLQSFVNSQGETWYNVLAADGTKGWVPAKTTLIENAPSSLPLIEYNNLKYRGSALLTAVSSKVKITNQLDIEDYLKGVVPNEMPSSWHIEALKAQAIVARSYAANSMMLKNTTASQVYKGYTSETDRTNQAVEATRGLVVKYNGVPIQTFFYSTSGGRTANVGDVWNSNQANFPYLVSVDDPYENSPHSSWQYKYSSGTILQSFGFNPSNTILYDIQIMPTGANGEVTGVTVKTSSGDKTITGNEMTIRKLFPIDGYYNILKSNWFTLSSVKEYEIQTNNGRIKQFGIKGQAVMLASGQTAGITANQMQIQTANSIITKESDPATITVNGKGWGHRIGMSQYGAKGFAENGWKAVDIVKHYFPGTTVSK